MDLLLTIKSFGAGAEELAFVLSLAVVSFFYSAYKQCEEELEKEKMLERFLSE